MLLAIAPTLTSAQVDQANDAEIPPPVGYAPVAAPYDPTAQQPRRLREPPTRAAFYGRLSGGFAADFFRLSDGEDSFLVTGGLSAHTDFSIGVRFAYVHALSLDFDFNRGLIPFVDGEFVEDGTLYTGALGLGYTRFVVDSGLYFSAGAGMGIAWLEIDDSDFTSPTGLGYALNGRIGYDFPSARRAKVGIAFTFRYHRLIDENDVTWRGPSLTFSGSASWY
jgi:hypothetical protein